MARKHVLTTRLNKKGFSRLVGIILALIILLILWQPIYKGIKGAVLTFNYKSCEGLVKSYNYDIIAECPCDPLGRKNYYLCKNGESIKKEDYENNKGECDIVRQESNNEPILVCKNPCFSCKHDILEKLKGDEKCSKYVDKMISCEYTCVKDDSGTTTCEALIKKPPKGAIKQGDYYIYLKYETTTLSNGQTLRITPNKNLRFSLKTSHNTYGCRMYVMTKSKHIIAEESSNDCYVNPLVLEFTPKVKYGDELDLDAIAYKSPGEWAASAKIHLKIT